MIPSSSLENHIGVLGKTGSGKTNAAKVTMEAPIEQGKRVCIVDPTGVWWGLRLRADGVTPGYPVVIFGGRHADVPFTQDDGERIGHLVAERGGPFIIDTKGMTVGARTRFFTGFAETLLMANRHPLHLVIDEAHVFMPQGKVPDPQSGRMLHAGNELVSGGRSCGLRVTLISQRPAKLNKDSLSQVETLVTMRLISPQDRDAVLDWVRENADPKDAKEMMTSLPALEKGDAWVWAPALPMFRRVHFPLAQTFDSSKAPEEGGADARPLPLAPQELEDLRRAMTGPKEEPPRRAAVDRVIPPAQTPAVPAPVSRDHAPKPKQEDAEVKESEARALREQNEILKAKIRALEAKSPDAPQPIHAAGAALDMDAIYAEIKRRAQGDPSILKALMTRPEIEVTVTRKVIETDENSLAGRVAILITEGFFDETATANAAFSEIKRRGFPCAVPSVYRACDQLASQGFLTKEKPGYRSVPGMKVNIIERAA